MKTKVSILKKTGLVCLITLLTSTLSACNIFPKEEQVQGPALIAPANVEYQYAEVVKGTIINSINGVGAFVSVNQKDLFFNYYKGGNIKNIYVKPGAVVKQGQLLAEIECSELEEQEKIEEILYKKAQLSYSIKKSSQNDYDKQLAELDLEMEKIKYESLKSQLAQTKITSPISGLVIFCEPLRPGQYVQSFQTILSVANPKDMQIEYTGGNVDNFKVGMKVNIKYKDKDYQGTVVSIPAMQQAEQGRTPKKYIRIALDKIPNDAELGDSVNISVEMQKKDNVLIVPRQAVHENNKHYYVQVLENNSKVEKFIEVGIQSNDKVEILSGVNEGDKIITE